MSDLVVHTLDGVSSSLYRRSYDLERINPIIPAGVIVYESDTRRWKIGDGFTAYKNLSYASGEIRFSGTGKQVSNPKIFGFVPD